MGNLLLDGKPVLIEDLTMTSFDTNTERGSKQQGAPHRRGAHQFRLMGEAGASSRRGTAATILAPA
jgi:hypothetical protein